MEQETHVNKNINRKLYKIGSVGEQLHRGQLQRGN